MSTQEELLLRKYSKLLEELTVENKVLLEELTREKQKSAMFYENSRRYKIELEDYKKKVQQCKSML